MSDEYQKKHFLQEIFGKSFPVKQIKWPKVVGSKGVQDVIESNNTSTSD